MTEDEQMAEARYTKDQDDRFKQKMAEVIYFAMHTGVVHTSVAPHMNERARAAYDAAEAFVAEMKRRGMRPS
jgi:hypothetical protein